MNIFVVLAPKPIPRLHRKYGPPGPWQADEDAGTDLAEIILDQCYKEKKNLGEGIFVDMTFEFIEESFNYRTWY